MLLFLCLQPGIALTSFGQMTPMAQTGGHSDRGSTDQAVLVFQ